MAGLVMTGQEVVSTMEERRIRDLVRRIVLRTAGIVDSAITKSGSQLVTEADLAGTATGSSLQIPAGAMITPLARDLAAERQIRLVERPRASVSVVEPKASPHVSSVARSRSRADAKVVALGADHGGYALKEILEDLLRELGYSVIDCGTDSDESVDYPDFAFAAARLVAQGKAWRAILVDGAGIGSCMAANKVPGVRAAMCYDEATAVNSREHNHANVLTLGAGLISAELGRQIVRTWLATDAGGGRHERRVKKIMDIEQRYLRT